MLFCIAHGSKKLRQSGCPDRVCINAVAANALAACNPQVLRGALISAGGYHNERYRQVSSTELTTRFRRDRFLLYAQAIWLDADSLPCPACVGGRRERNIQQGQTRAEAEPLAMRYLPRCPPKITAARRAAFENIEATHPRAGCPAGDAASAEQAEAARTDAAVATLDGIELTRMCPRSTAKSAQFKAITLQGSDCPP